MAEVAFLIPISTGNKTNGPKAIMKLKRYFDTVERIERLIKDKVDFLSGKMFVCVRGSYTNRLVRLFHGEYAVINEVSLDRLNTFEQEGLRSRVHSNTRTTCTSVVMMYKTYRRGRYDLKQKEKQRGTNGPMMPTKRVTINTTRKRVILEEIGLPALMFVKSGNVEKRK